MNPSDPLTPLEEGILAFEADNAHWKFAGARDAAVLDRFGLSPTLYALHLDQAIEKWDAQARWPQLVGRLRRLREARRAARSARQRR